MVLTKRSAASGDENVLYAAPNLCWACALASPVTFLTGGHVVQIAFGRTAFSFIYKRSENEIKASPPCERNRILIELLLTFAARLA